MMGELYTVHEMPEQPKEGFFKGLFGGGAKLLDREELCEYMPLKKHFLKIKLIINISIFYSWRAEREGESIGGPAH